MTGIAMIGLASFAIYGLSFEYVVMMTPRKGESLTTGSINLWANVIALLIYLILHYPDNPLYAT